MKVLCKKNFLSPKITSYYYKKELMLYEAGKWYTAEKSEKWEYGHTFRLDYIRVFNDFEDNFFYVGYYNYDPKNVNAGVAHECANFNDFFYNNVELRKLKLVKINDNK